MAPTALLVAPAGVNVSGIGGSQGESSHHSHSSYSDYRDESDITPLFGRLSA